MFNADFFQEMEPYRSCLPNLYNFMICLAAIGKLSFVGFGVFFLFMLNDLTKLWITRTGITVA